MTAHAKFGIHTSNVAELSHVRSTGPGTCEWVATTRTLHGSSSPFDGRFVPLPGLEELERTCHISHPMRKE